MNRVNNLFFFLIILLVNGVSTHFMSYGGENNLHTIVLILTLQVGAFANVAPQFKMVYPPHGEAHVPSILVYFIAHEPVLVYPIKVLPSMTKPGPYGITIAAPATQSFVF